MKHALLAGASGLVGGFCLQRLLAHPAYSNVTVWSRRALPLTHEKLRVELIDFDRMPALGNPVDEVFCCLGTTIRKAGTQTAFRRVDHDYPVALAHFARASGAAAFLMVSALGADPNSRVFYSRIKGETEADVMQAGIERTLFFRPSILFGERRENRPGERIGIAVGRLIAPLLVGRLVKYRPIPAAAVAEAMVRAAVGGMPSGIIESDAIARLAAASN